MGRWRLALASDGIAFDALAHIRTTDGILTAMHATVPALGRVHRVATFNAASNVNQRSILRLVNWGDGDARVRVPGADDSGVLPGSTVRLAVPGGSAVELSAVEPGSGQADAIESGALGDGVGKWWLRVEADRDVAVLSLLWSPMGRLTNLSPADGARGFDTAPAAALPPPGRVTLERAGDRELRGRWSAVPGAQYAVDLLRATARGRSTARWTARRAHRSGG